MTASANRTRGHATNPISISGRRVHGSSHRWENAPMKKVMVFAAVAAFASVAMPTAQQPRSGVDVSAALKGVAPDIDARLARFKPVKMPYDASALSARERQMVDQLVVALRQLENMFWRQSDPEGLAL